MAEVAEIVEHLPPHDLEAERSLLGAIMIDPALLDRVGHLPAESLYSQAHRLVLRAMREVKESGRTPEVVTLRSYLERTGRLDAVGGPAYVADLLVGVPKSANVRHYARVIEDAASRRAIIAQAQGLASAARDGEPPTALADLAEGLRDVTRTLGGGRDAVDLWSPSVRPERPEFIVDGLLRRRGLGLLWSAPNLGKTTFVLRLIHELIARDRPMHFLGNPALAVHSGFERVLLVTTEETAPELRFMAETVHRGMGSPELAGRLLHRHAVADGRRLTLDELPGIVEHDRPECLVLDSLTGLRPKIVRGERVRWDADNDAANELLLRMRTLAEEYALSILLVHHSSKGGEEYRGPTEWWAAVDVMFGLLAEGNGRVRVKPQKVRGGRVPDPFLVESQWTGDTVTLGYAGMADDTALTPTDEKVLAFMRGAGACPQYVVIEQVDACRRSVLSSLRRLEERGVVERTGEKVKNSPVWQPCIDLLAQVGGETR